MINYQYIPAFIAIGHQLNFTKAARTLGITQAAISRQLKLLEESVGEQLVIRSPKKVLLTTRGEQLFHIWTKFESQLANEFLEKKIGTIRLGIVEGIQKEMFFDAVSHFRKLHAIGIEITIDKTDSMIHKLENNELDVVISPKDFQGTFLTSVKLIKETRVLISSSPLKGKSNRDLIESCGDKIALIYSERDDLTKFIHNKKNLVKINSFTGLLELTKRLDGFSVVPQHTLPSQHKFYTYPWKARNDFLYATTMSFEKLPLPFKEFINVIKEAFNR